MKLLEPFHCRGITIPNRVAVSPMSQYRARDGVANDWHFAHLSRFALGGAGLVFCEATAVNAEGRRTPGDLGLWQDQHIEPLKRINNFLRECGSVPGVQLAHAGRKGSERRPWHGETPVNAEDIELRKEHPWTAVGATSEPYGEGWPEPHVLSEAEIGGIVDDFARATERADQAGFDVIEVYAAHGFLLHQFYSPLCNSRTDGYGGDFAGRTRLCREVAQAIRAHWPDDKMLVFRLSATDWIDGGWTIEDSQLLAAELKADGVDAIDCSSGGIGGPHPLPRFPLGPAFQAELAASIRAAADIHTLAVGFIWQPDVANQLIESGQCDMVALARELLHNPNWTLHAAAELGADKPFDLWPDEFGWWLGKRARAMNKLGMAHPRLL